MPIKKQKRMRPDAIDMGPMLDNALDAVESHLAPAIAVLPAHTIRAAFMQHAKTHLKPELLNIQAHGHRNDDPNDNPIKSQVEQRERADAPPDPELDAVSEAVNMAVEDQKHYLNSGNVTADYGDEWAAVALGKAHMFLHVGRWAKRHGLAGLEQAAVELARDLEAEAKPEVQS